MSLFEPASEVAVLPSSLPLATPLLSHRCWGDRDVKRRRQRSLRGLGFYKNSGREVGRAHIGRLAMCKNWGEMDGFRAIVGREWTAVAAVDHGTQIVG